jgi:regulator of protease activity HflC (stomatin/prohibitin superfamily)
MIVQLAVPGDQTTNGYNEAHPIRIKGAEDMNLNVIFTGISTLAWVGAIAIVVLTVLRASRNKPTGKAGVTIAVVIILAIVLSAVSSGMVFINPQERGVVISAVAPGGYRQEALQPGLRWVIPFAESVVTYPISKQTYTMSVAPNEGQIQGDDSIECRTSDGQKVLVDASVIYQIDPAKVVQVHIQWQTRYDNDLVRAQVRGIIRDKISQFGIEEVYSSRRAEMVKEVSDQLGAKLNDNGLILVDFVLRNISFSPEYAASVEQKQIAEQLAQQAKFTVEQKKQEADQAREVAKGLADAAVTKSQGEAKAVVIAANAEAEARIINANAEAKALETIAKVLNASPTMLTYQYITKLAPNVQVMFLPNDSPFIFPLQQYGPTLPTESVPVVP